MSTIQSTANSSTPDLIITVRPDPAVTAQPDPDSTVVTPAQEEQANLPMEIEDIETRTSGYSGNVFPESDDWTHYEGIGWVHESEDDDFRSDYFECPITGNWTSTDESFVGWWRGPLGHGRPVEETFSDSVRDQFTRCAYADELYYDDHFSFSDVRGYGEVCDRNIDNFYFCESCSEYVTENGYHGDGRCNNCQEEDEDSSVIREYNCREYPPFKGKGPRFFGVEVEVEVSDRTDRGTAAEDVLDHLGSDNIIIKNDRSINHGFEIVSGPQDLASHERLWAKLQGCRQHKYLSSWDTSTCGMHVHVSRKGFYGDLHLARVVTFVNNPVNASFIREVAGRDPSEWAKLVAKRLACAHRSPHDKYVAVNLDHRDTVEFRIFKGTIQPEHIMRNLEFIDSLLNFCAPAQRSITEALDGEAFKRWVSAAPQRKKYKRFVAWMEARSLIAARPRKTQAPVVAEAASCDDTLDDTPAFPPASPPTEIPREISFMPSLWRSDAQAAQGRALYFITHEAPLMAPFGYDTEVQVFRADYRFTGATAIGYIRQNYYLASDDTYPLVYTPYAEVPDEVVVPGRAEPTRLVAHYRHWPVHLYREDQRTVVRISETGDLSGWLNFSTRGGTSFQWATSEEVSADRQARQTQAAPPPVTFPDFLPTPPAEIPVPAEPNPATNTTVYIDRNISEIDLVSRYRPLDWSPDDQIFVRSNTTTRLMGYLRLNAEGRLAFYSAQTDAPIPSAHTPGRQQIFTSDGVTSNRVIIDNNQI